MKKPLVFLLFTMVSLHTAVAQQMMFMGKITSADGKPLRGAGIYLKGKEDKAAVIADNTGLFTSRMLPEGEYAVTIVSGNREIIADKIQLSSTTAKKYYHFTLNGNKVTATTSDANPYMEAKLSEIEASDRWLQFPMNAIIYRFDTSWKLKKIISETDPVNPKR